MHNALAQFEVRALFATSTQRGLDLYEDEQMRQWVDRVAGQAGSP